MKGPGLKFYIEIIRTFFCIDVSVMDAICETIPVKKWKKKNDLILFILPVFLLLFFFFSSYKMFDSKMHIKISFQKWKLWSPSQFLTIDLLHDLMESYLNVQWCQTTIIKCWGEKWYKDVINFFCFERQFITRWRCPIPPLSLLMICDMLSRNRNHDCNFIHCKKYAPYFY